ncbi:ECF-type sigma factor [Arenimonas caeni]|jgi:RNA polymerase sigma factor (TIGR02999 family)|uniref:RNA polymerase subunit sigma n=1 Tax=Arenimonas caeni TaxID=2058085 RepID=A0A2P6MCN9_9GAMM|nr:ECF-type sigma factor [Arenimonas caeni]MDY0022187.1 ECF-type sigma factor [Arenimonas caeni]PRH83765.1 RNA polymerase subunit sigma [Arenimonas caeni]
MNDTPDENAADDAGPVPASLDEQIYAQLRAIARRQLARWGNAATTSPTTIVHEAWMRLAGNGGEFWADRGHFLAVASRAMRQLLVDKARRRLAAKRGAGAVHLDNAELAGDDPLARATVLNVDSALAALERHDEVLARVVECRFFAGLTTAETALALGRSVRTVERDWARARAYLVLALQD